MQVADRGAAAFSWPRAVGGGDRSDAALMTRIAAHDAAALTVFYDHHSAVVFAFCLRALKDHAEAEDVTLEVFWEIWDRPARYDLARANPLTYLLRLTRSRIIDHLRSSQSRRRTRDVHLQQNAAAATAGEDQDRGPLGHAMLGDERTQVLGAMERLTPEQRTALELAFLTR
jgi:RNA polymerase sigma-70 factor (ECF subfamily)